MSASNLRERLVADVIAELERRAAIATREGPGAAKVKAKNKRCHNCEHRWSKHEQSSPYGCTFTVSYSAPDGRERYVACACRVSSDDLAEFG